MDIGLISAIAGSVLGFLATLAGGVVTEFFKSRNLTKSYKISLRLELKDTLKSLDDIRTAQTRQNNMYDFTLIDLLDRNVENLQNARANISLLSDSEAQRDAFAVITKVSVLAKEMRGIQNYEYNAETPPDTTPEQKAAFVKDRKDMNNLLLVDVKRDINDLGKKIN